MCSILLCKGYIKLGVPRHFYLALILLWEISRISKAAFHSNPKRRKEESEVNRFEVISCFVIGESPLGLVLNLKTLLTSFVTFV